MQATSSTTQGETRKAAVNGLAVVGFGALIIAGIFLAIYAARYVPETLSRLSSAVILSGDEANNPQDEETPAVATNDSEDNVDEEIHFGNDDEVVVEDEAPAAPVPTTPTPAPTDYLAPTVSQYPPYVVSTSPELYGRADLVITNAEIGYFRGATFIEDNEVPEGRDAAVRFTVKNLGTNVAEGWKIRVDVESEDTAVGNGGILMPDGTQKFTLRVENPKEGENLRVEIDVDYQDKVDESNEGNNDKNLDVDVEDDD